MENIFLSILLQVTDKQYSDEVYRQYELKQAGIRQHIITLIAIVVCVFVFIVKMINKNIQEEKRRKQLEKENEEKRLKLEEEKEMNRLKKVDFFMSKIESIREANLNFLFNTNFENGYFSNYQMVNWISENKILYEEIKDEKYQDIQLVVADVDAIRCFLSYNKSTKTLKDEYNQKFKDEELKRYSKFFDNIEGNKLDIQQRTAVVTDEDNNIVVAGAGSGKTTTIVGKVNYVIDKYKIAPEDILLISFTNKSATTLADKIAKQGITRIEAKTFHKFGKDIIVDVEKMQPSIFEDGKFKGLLSTFFKQHLQNEYYLNLVTDYFNNFLKPVKSQFDFNNHGEYIQYIKDQNFVSYKQIEINYNGRRSVKLEQLKSIEECKIANFLLFNGIEYEYEAPYEINIANLRYKQYKPDFTIKQNGIKLYIEHFGVSRKNTVPKWFKGDSERTGTEKYLDGMEWKRQTHLENETILIETYSYEMSEGILFDNLTKNLEQAGIILVKKSPTEIWELINKYAEDEVISFKNIFATFINLIKSNNYTILDLQNRNRLISDSFLKRRNIKFIEIIKPIYDSYQKHLIDTKEIDFSDMINKATEYILNDRYKKQYKYIIIDEFQDISIGRYQLLNALKTKNPSCKLFCVGDDWQSIYRFSGSDIALFKEFEKYFGFTEKLKIETTYRFFNPLIKLTSDFIQKNPNQAKKDLKSISTTNATKYRIQYSIPENKKDTKAVKSIFDELITNYEEIQSKHIYILGRYGFDINRIGNEFGVRIVVREYLENGNEDEVLREFNFTDNYWRNLKANEKIFVKYSRTINYELIQIEAEFTTIHKAKGLESDIVVLLNCNSGKYGFPSQMSDDPVLNLLLSEADQYENGEERRLFYVAMTRAKEMLYFVADSTYKSKFIKELEKNGADSSENGIDKCNVCKDGEWVLRKSAIAKNGNKYKSYGCTNFPTFHCSGYKTVFEEKDDEDEAEDED